MSTVRDALISAVYAAVPDVACKGLCQAACGPIACSAMEADALREGGINPPGVRNHPTQGPLTCSHLTDAGRCRIYENRPLICRLWGATPKLKCPHGCRPAQMLPETRSRTLMTTLIGDQPIHLALEIDQ